MDIRLLRTGEKGRLWLCGKLTLGFAFVFTQSIVTQFEQAVSSVWYRTYTHTHAARTHVRARAHAHRLLHIKYYLQHTHTHCFIVYSGTHTLTTVYLLPLLQGTRELVD